MNRAERRAAEKAHQKMFPEVLTEVPSRLWPDLDETGPRRIAVFVSRKYLVQLFNEGNGIIRMSVNRTKLAAKGWADRIGWDELMQVKREIGRAHQWAVEVYPDDQHVVNVANMRHLWLLPEAPEFAWMKGDRR